MTDLLTRHPPSQAVGFTDAAHELRTEALDKALEVSAVTDADSQAVAVDAQEAIKRCLKLIEDGRQVYVREMSLINRSTKEFVKQLVEHDARLGKLVGDFQALQEAKAMSANAALNENLTQLERDREARLAECNTFEAREAVWEEFQAEVRALPEAVAAPRAKGQVITHDWEFNVTDKRLLAQMHPHLVNIEPRRAEIKNELRAGRKVHGIEAKQVVNATVRVGKGGNNGEVVVR